jgi:glycosyltransferase involved in cell wall biosynthesis
MAKIILVSLVHNRKHLVGAAIQSAVNQTLLKDKWAHLIIDNASDDGADKVVEVFAEKYNHIVFHRMNTNLGQQPAFNYVLNEWIPKNSPGAEILVNLDSDDELMPNALEEVEKIFDSHPEIGQVYSGFDIIDGKGRIKVKNHSKAKMVKDQFTAEGQRQLRRIFVSQNPVGHIRGFRIKCLRNIGGFCTKYCYSTDYAIAGQMLMKYSVVKINKVLYRWRQHNDQVERQHSPQQTADWKSMQLEFAKLFKEKGLI